MAQGIFEGLIYGAILSVVFTLVIGVVSRGAVTFKFALKHLAPAASIALAAWCLGGLIAMGLAALSPDFFHHAFRGVPHQPGEMLKYAWVGGSIWGILFGAAISVIIVSVIASNRWRRRTQAAT